MRLRLAPAWPGEAPALAVASLALLLALGSALRGLGPAAPAFPAAPSVAAPAAPAAAAPGPLDLNRADGAALQTLPGIGPALARRILDYRAAHGPFAQADELRQVPGIGPARWAGLASRVRVAAP